MRNERPKVVRRFALVTLLLPAAVTAAGLIVQLVAMTRARDAANDDGVLVLTVALGFGLPAVIGLSGLPGLRRGNRGPTYRLFGADALGLSVLLTLVMTFLPLRADGTSLDDGRLVATLIVGLLAGVAAAVAAWFLQPKGSPPAAAPSVVPLGLASNERAAWMRTASLPLPAVAIICAVVTIVAIKAGFAWAGGDRGGVGAILTAVALLLIALICATAAFRVRVDANGLTVRSMLGVPRFRVPPQEVDAVAVVDSRSLGVPGSWGIRILPHRVTIVMRSTTGIRVTRRDGRIFFVTVDDAARGASLLEALAAQNQGAAPDSPADDDAKRGPRRG